MARVLGVTAAGYHAWKKRPVSRHTTQDDRLRLLIEEAHQRSRGIYGAPRVHAELAMAHGVHTSRKRIARLMAEMGLTGVSRRTGAGSGRKVVAQAPAALFRGP
jgi:putative transposase